MANRSFAVQVFAVLLFSLSFLTSAQGQYRASLQGTVTDPQGAVVPDANVILTDKETGRVQQTKTNGNGVYSFSQLAPNAYFISVQKDGFKKKDLDNVSIIAEQANSVNVVMDVGSATDTVTVNGGEAPLIDTETGNLVGTLSTREIQSLPSVGRDPYQLARLAPGVFGDGASNGNGSGRGLPGSNQSSSGSTGSIFMTENQPQITSGGTRNNGNSYQIDGVEVNSLAYGGSAVITPNEEAVKEVQIQSNPYSAENGRNSGAQVLVVTKNGTNTFHGSLFMKIHRPGVDAYQPWNGTGSEQAGTPDERGLLRDANRFNQIGGSVGGPVYKNKLFFFFSYETLRNTIAGAGPKGWFETPEFDSLVASFNPNSIASQITGFAGTNIKFASIIPTSCAQLGLLPAQCADVNGGLDVGSPMNTPLGTSDPTFGAAGTPSGVGGGLDGIPDIFDVTTQQTNKQIATQWNGRLDFQATNKDLLAFTVFWVPNNNDSFFNGPPRDANLWNSDRLNYSFATLWNHTFSPTLQNEARFNVTRWWFDEIKTNSQLAFGIPEISFLSIGLGVDNSGGEPNTPCRYCQLFGPAGPGVFYQTTYNIRDTLTKVQSSHSLKFGADIYKEQDNDVTVWAGLPNYNFNNLWDFVNDAPRAEGAGFDPRTGVPHSSTKRVRSNILGFFAQDDYKLKPTFTVNLGLRWEYFGPIHEKNGQLSTAVLGSGSNTLTGLRMQVGGNMYHASYNNWGPQIGFAWSPKGVLGHDFNNRFVVRGGFGAAYNRLQEAVTLNGRFNPPLDEQFSLWSGGLTGSNIFYSLANDIHNFDSYPSNPATVLTFDPNTNLPSCAPATCAPVGVTGFDHDMPTPLVYRYSVEGQYDLGSRWVATVGYQGSQSRHFTRQINNLNWFYPNNLNPAVGSVDFYTNDANGHYNALLTRLEHQFARDFSLDTQYVYSSCIDQGSQDYFADPFPFDASAAQGHCDYDATHNLKLFGIWAPHFFGGRNWMEKTLGGWKFSGIFTYHNGFPFSPVFSAPVVTGQVVPAAYTGGAGSNYSNSTFEKTGNFSQLASVTCPCTSIPYFGIPTLDSSGLPTRPGLERNLFRGPRYRQFDFTAGKEFGLPNMKVLGEDARISLRADFFNLFNTLNLSPISGYQNVGGLSFDSTTNTTTVSGVNTSFGKGTTALGARVIEFTFRLQF
jgi:hypothetical protein